MSRTLASIQRILNIEPIPNAKNISFKIINPEFLLEDKT